MKRYIRNKNGEFCSAKDWFAEYGGDEYKTYWLQQCERDFRKCESALETLRARCSELLTIAETAIYSANDVYFQAGCSTAEISVYSSGRVQIYLTEAIAGRFSGEILRTTDRAQIFAAVAEAYARRLQEQTVVVTEANATFFETEG